MLDWIGLILFDLTSTDGMGVGRSAEGPGERETWTWIKKQKEGGNV